MRYKCQKCGRYAEGPITTRKACPYCGSGMSPVTVEITEDGRVIEKDLNLFEEGRRK